LGEAKKILGMEITRDIGSGELWLSQKNYVLKMLERFNMAEVRTVTTPFKSLQIILQAVSTITERGGRND